MKLKFRGELKDIIIFIIFCIFLLYLVAIAVLNLASVAREGYFHGLNPIPAFSADFILPTLLFFVMAIVAIIASASSFFL